MPVRWGSLARQEDLHPSPQRRRGCLLAAKARIHEGHHLAFAAALGGDQLRRTMGQRGNISPTPKIWDGLRLGLARQESWSDFTEGHEMLAFQVPIQRG